MQQTTQSLDSITQKFKYSVDKLLWKDKKISNKTDFIQL